MTFEDDFVELGLSPVVRQRCKRLGLECPPPEYLALATNLRFRRVSMSTLTDADRASMQHVCRGARYEIDLGEEHG